MPHFFSRQTVEVYYPKIIIRLRATLFDGFFVVIERPFRIFLWPRRNKNGSQQCLRFSITAICQRGKNIDGFLWVALNSFAFKVKRGKEALASYVCPRMLSSQFKGRSIVLPSICLSRHFAVSLTARAAQ